MTTVQPSSSTRVVGPARVDHRLDREHQPVLSRRPRPRRPVVRAPAGSSCIAVPMPWPTYSRTTEKPAAVDDRLDRGADVAQPVAGHGRVDRGLQRGPGHVDQPLRLVVDLADRNGHRGVGVPALDDRAAVDRDDVALLEHPVAGDAVHDHLVG